MNIVSRIGVQAAVKAARELYPTEEEALERVALQLCLTPEAVSEALRPVSMAEELAQ